MIYFIADTHFNHANIIELSNRPFKDIIEMNKTLIERWNKKIKCNDTVYHLGDFAFGKYDDVNKIRLQLNGKKNLIIGNHDYRNSIHKHLNLFANIQYYEELAYNKQRIVLFHYPIREWNGKYHGSIHLHGHSHSLPRKHEQKMLNVCCDLHNFEPLSIDEVITYMEE